MSGSNNTNKFSPQERLKGVIFKPYCSNNTNKFSPQEHLTKEFNTFKGSNNTNKFSPQELFRFPSQRLEVQIIQINSALKNNKQVRRFV